MISDEALDYWGRVYRLVHVADHDIMFDQFIESPHAFLRRIKATHYLPLLASQRAVMRRLQGDAAPMWYMRETTRRTNNVCNY